jgi:hypothetical protein
LSVGDSIIYHAGGYQDGSAYVEFGVGAAEGFVNGAIPTDQIATAYNYGGTGSVDPSITSGIPVTSGEVFVAFGYSGAAGLSNSSAGWTNLSYSGFLNLSATINAGSSAKAFTLAGGYGDWGAGLVSFKTN